MEREVWALLPAALNRPIASKDASLGTLQTRLLFQKHFESAI